MKSKYLSCLVALVVLLSAPFATEGAAGTATSSDPIAKIESPESFQKRLLETAGQRLLSSKEHFDLALAFLRSASSVESLTIARVGLGTTTNDLEKAAFYGIISQNYGALGNYQAAAQAALEGQRLNPTNSTLAALRLAYFDRIGGLAQKKAAEDTLAQLNPTGEKISLQGKGIMMVVMYGKQIIEVLANIYEKYYEENLVRQSNGGRILKPTAGERLMIVAEIVEKLWPLVSSQLNK